MEIRFASESLARSFVAGDLDEDAMVERVSTHYFRGKKPRWLRPLARFVSEYYEEKSIRPSSTEVARVILKSRSFQNSWRTGKVIFGPDRLPSGSEMLPGKGAPKNWEIPPATTFAELAKLLELHIDDLGWLSLQSRKINHYYYRWHRKRGTKRGRLIEIPKPLLKDTQRIVLRKILDRVPPHESARGFCRGKSILDFLEPHHGKRLVLKMDFRDFFPSIGSGKVFRLFMTAGYPETVASVLTDLCTNRLGQEYLADPGLDFSSRSMFSRSHLPQGAPTSPALANLCSFRLDCRLTGLAKSAGAEYSRYADDLLFSGNDDFRRQRENFHIAALNIALEEGFNIHPRKTRFMFASQRQFAGGLVLNEKPNLSRREFDKLKAILTNCLRHGWESQNREGHPDFRGSLQGRIAWASRANPEKARKLRDLFDAIPRD